MESEETNIPAQPEVTPTPDVKKPRAPRRTTTRKASAEATTAPEADGGSTEAPAAKVKKTTVRKPRASKAAAAEEVAPAAVSEPASPPTGDGEKTVVRTRVRRVSLKPREATEEASTPAAPAAPAPVPASDAAAPTVERPMEHPATSEAAAPSAPLENVPARPAQRRQEEHHTHTRDIREREDERDLEATPGFSVPETVGGNEGGGSGNRRKRRRRNRRGGEGTPQVQQGSNLRVDPDELVRRAWKIYLGEVTEEGLALMDDRTATEASRRAFRVAELFLLEAARHRPSTEEAPTETPEEEE